MRMNQRPILVHEEVPMLELWSAEVVEDLQCFLLSAFREQEREAAQLRRLCQASGTRARPLYARLEARLAVSPLLEDWT